MRDVMTRVCCGAVFALCCMSDIQGMKEREVKNNRTELNDQGEVLGQESEEEEEASENSDPFRAAYTQVHNDNLHMLLADSMIRAMKPYVSTDCIENYLARKCLPLVILEA